MTNSKTQKKIIDTLTELEQSTQGTTQNKIHNIRCSMLEVFKRFESCWVCGTRDDMTQHHLQRRRHRSNNLGSIPLCEKHHKNVEGIRDAIDICIGEKRMTVTRLKQVLRDMGIRKTVSKDTQDF